MTRPPCYDEETGTDCGERRVGCREGCERWAEYVAIHAMEKERIRKQKERDCDVNRFIFSRKRRALMDSKRRYISGIERRKPLK